MRRALPIVLGVLVVLGGLVGVMLFANGRDDAGVGADTGGPGVFEATSQGDPPTSGAHEQRNVTGEKSVDEDQLLTALEQGDVVFAYPDAEPPAALQQLREDLAGPFDVELAAAGQMIILVRRPVDGVVALAWKHRLKASGPDDPQLRAFAEAWLGKGASGG